MITVITKMTVRPEKHREFLQTIMAMMNQASKQNGCLSRDFYRDTRNEHSFVLLEEWERTEDLDQHFRSEWFHVLLGTRNLLQHEAQITLLAHSAPMQCMGAGSSDR